MTRLHAFRRWIIGLTACGLVLATFGAPARAEDRRWSWPLLPRPDLVAGFDPPADPYGPGHRGADLAGRVGQAVRSVAAGTVRFAGMVAGRGVVVIDHGAQRSTYEPVVASTRAGQPVRAGEVVGRLELVGSHCWPRACLHLGRVAPAGYLDPMALLGGGSVRLLPFDVSFESLVARAAPVRSVVRPLADGGYVDLNNFGDTGPAWHAFHTGDDLAAPCGTPVYAAMAGTVEIDTTQSWSGQWLVKVVDGRTSTAIWYAHLQSLAVRDGQRVVAGQRIGAVGDEGNTSGCHLHLEVHPHNGSLYEDPVDPGRWFDRHGVPL